MSRKPLGNEYEIRGDITAIKLRRKNGSIETIIDTKDLVKVKSFRGSWYPRWNETTKSFYVQGSLVINDKRITPRLHRWIMDTPDNLCVDHINHNTLDNRRSNLRNVTRAENQQNIKEIIQTNKSGYRGVSWHSPGKKWRARSRVNGSEVHLGLFSDINEAAKVACDFRIANMPGYIHEGYKK